MSKKNYFTFISLLFFNVLLLSACSSSQNSQAVPASPTDSNDSDSDQGNVSQEMADKTIVINANRCSGCGRCAQIDSEHFSFDRSVRKGVVIAQGNTGSSNLQMAIAMCRDRAISLD
ncbi:MAG: ferredoxin [Patescibacteria group bacterium]|nr:ferredoxin [Patescibacteria group bacterium]